MCLWDHATNRNLYNSYEHLINLLGICEVDILYWTLRLLMKPAMRISGQRSLRQPFAMAQQKLLVLGGKWPVNVDFDQLLSSQVVGSLESIPFSYYRTAKEIKDLGETDGSGLVSISIPTTLIPSVDAVLTYFTETKKAFNVSDLHALELMHKARVAAFLQQPTERSQLLACRIMALTILAQIYSEETADQKLFTDPDLITRCASLAIYEAELQLQLRFLAVSALDSFSHYRGRMNEVLGAINASTNHGHVMFLLRKITNASEQDDDYNYELIDALFSSISFIFASQSGANMLISAGIIPVLVSSLTSKAPLKSISKCMLMLDTIQSGISPSMDVFNSVNGVSIVVSRIEQEIEACLLMESHFSPDQFLHANLPDPGINTEYRTLLGRTPLLRALMKLILHLMQNSGTADGMRNLIDSSLPASLLKVFEHSRLFGVVGIFGLATNVMSTFVHNEPTCLSILQELGVTAAFLKASMDELPVSPEVISAFPNAFGAICLNASGLEMFTNVNPIPFFLSVFTKQEHLNSLLDNDVPHLSGNSIDELVRHHPSLKDMIMKAVVDMLNQVVEIGLSLKPILSENCILYVDGKVQDQEMTVDENNEPIPDVVAGTDIKLDLATETRMSKYIDVLSRFLEGLFQNVAHCKDFIKFQGLESLLKLYSLECIPYDFATSSSSASMSYLFRSIIDVNVNEAIKCIYNEIQNIYGRLGPFLNESNISMTYINLAAKEEDLINSSHVVFRSLVTLKCYLRLLNDVYCSNSLSHSKSLTSLIELFDPQGRPVCLIDQLCRVFRVCTLEKLEVKKKVPEGWIKPPEKKSESSTDVTPPLEGIDSTAAKNTKMLYHLLEDIPSDISLLFRGILKILCHRRVTSDAHKKTTQAINDRITKGAMSVLQWDRASADADYLTLGLQHLRSLMCEERASTTHLQTYVAFSLYESGYITHLLEIFKTFSLVKLTAALESDPKANVTPLMDVIDLLIDIFQCLVSDKYLVDSPHTATLYARLKDSKGGFEIAKFLIKMRLLIFPCIVQVFESKVLSKMTTYSVNRVVGSLLLVLRSEGENTPVSQSRPNPGPFSLANLSSQLFGRPVAPVEPPAPPRADPANVDLIVDMGFPRPAAELALIRCGNNVMRATDYILTHPEVLSAPASSVPSATAAPTTVADSNAAPSTTAEAPAAIEGAPAPGAVPAVVDTAVNAERGELVASDNVAGPSIISVSDVPAADSLDESSEFVLEEPKSAGSSNPNVKEIEEPVIPEPDYKSLLEEMRKSYSAAILDRCITFLNEIDGVSLVFGIKELVCLLGKTSIAAVSGRIISTINGHNGLILSGAFDSDPEGLKKTEGLLYVHYHLLALIVADTNFKEVLASDEFSQLSPVDRLTGIQSFQQWLSPLLLVMEAYLSHCDAPLEVTLKATPEAFGIVEVNKPEKISTEKRVSLIQHLIRILKFESVDNNTLQVILRILVRLTLKWEIAVAFIENGGFQVLYESEKLAVFPTQQSLVMLITRHCVEEPEVLQKVMKKELKKFMTTPRVRTFDLNSLIKSCSHIVCRSPKDFCIVLNELCKLQNYSATPTLRSSVICLKETSETSNEEENEEGRSGNDLTGFKTPLRTPIKSKSFLDANPRDAGKVVHYLTSLLVGLKHKENDKRKHLMHCILFQGLCELFVSFPKCRMDFFQATQKKSSKPTPKSNGSKKQLFGYLMNEIIPIDLSVDQSVLQTISQEEIDRRVESTWAVRMLVALCFTKETLLEEDIKDELQFIKSSVIETLCKSLKDAISLSSENVPFEVKFGKISSLAYLSTDILNPKDKICESFETALTLEPHFLAISKIMIEKGLVGLLTSALAEVDINHPGCSQVVKAIIPALDRISSAAIKMGKAMDVPVSGSTVKVKKTPSSFDSALRDLEESHNVEDTPHEINDMFRNSALGMLEPSLRDDTNASDSDSSEEDIMDYSEEDMDDEDDSDEGSQTDDDMEIVVPQPYHGMHENEDDSSDSEPEDNGGPNPFLDGAEIVVPVEDMGGEDDDEDDEDDDDEDDEDDDDDDEDDGMHEDIDFDHDPDEDGDGFDEHDDEVDNLAGPATADELRDIEDIFGHNPVDDDEEMIDDEEMEAGALGAPSHRRAFQQNVVAVGSNGIELQWIPSGGPLGDLLGGNARPNVLTGGVNQDMTHPLLVNQEINAIGINPSMARNNSNISRALFNDVEDLSQMQMELLDRLFSTSRPMTVSRGDFSGSIFSTTLPVAAASRLLGTNASSNTSLAPQPEQDQQKLHIHAYILSFTDDRWKQEAQIQFGSHVIESALKNGNMFLNTLLPAAYDFKLQEDEKLRIKKEKEEEEKKRLEEERLKQVAEEEAAKKKAEEEAAAIASDHHIDDEEMAVDQSNESANPSASEDVPPAPVVEERVIVVVDGNPIDITGSGIDLTFLEALPDDLRMEVINQHLRERELSRARDAVGGTSSLNPEFLDALPFEIREEVIRQERLEMEQREAATRSRQVAEEMQRQSTASAQTRVRERVADTTSSVEKSSTSKSKSLAVNRESIQLVDSSNITSLLRLIFLPDSSSKDSLFKLLGNLCENSKTRQDLIGLLISVLSAGSSDLASVDKTFSQLTLKNSSSSKTSISKDEGSSVTSAAVPDSTAPNLVAQRCLEALTFFSTAVGAVGKYFLTESEAPQYLLKTPKPKKSKGKEKLIAPQLVYPIVLLLNLLEQPSMISSSIVLENLMHLLSNVLRPLSHIAKKKFSNDQPKDQDTNMEEDKKDSIVTKTDTKKSSDISSSKEKDKNDIKLPALPNSAVTNVVKVLKDGTSSSKSFQFTLSVIQYLCSYPAYLNLIVMELLSCSQSLGDAMINEIDLLLNHLKSIDSGENTNTAILEHFTSAGATQAKFLRILKTIDFLFSKTNDAILSYPYLSALEVFKSIDKDEMPTDMEVLEKMYDRLKLSKLWQKLGEAMSIIDTKEDLIHIGTILLPFIESFMVVSKPSVSLSKKHHALPSLPHVLFKHQNSELSDVEKDGFLVFAEANKRVLNTMVRNNPTLMNGSFSLLVQNPKVLEFDNKRTYFTLQLHKGSNRRNHQQIQINVRRQYVFEESYQQLQGRSGEAIKYGKLNVRFRDEEGVDAGGVTREWFSALALQMFNPDYALFRPSAADRVTYQPNRASGINPDHLFYFKFVGRIIGKAIYDGRLLDAHFTRSFYKCMISAPVDHKDMEAIDPEFYKSLDWILNNDITDILDLNFSLEVDDFGRQKIIDLKENGRHIPVTDADKTEYVRLVVQQKLVVAIQDQIQAFLSGFHEIIPRDLIRIFNEQELELLISGLPDIDIDDWKNNTEYQNYTASSPQIQWFWRAVRSFSGEERAKLIQFATGTSKVPLGGFTKLQGSSGIQKFQIHKEFSSTARLPSAHTCFNQIDLPQYDSYEQLRSLLLLAINESEGFGFA